jgi:hypothetical protein
MFCSLFKFIFYVNSGPFWKVLAFEILHRMRPFMLNFYFSSNNCPSARCASAANVVFRNIDVF